MKINIILAIGIFLLAGTLRAEIKITANFNADPYTEGGIERYGLYLGITNTGKDVVRFAKGGPGGVRLAGVYAPSRNKFEIMYVPIIHGEEEGRVRIFGEADLNIATLRPGESTGVYMETTNKLNASTIIVLIIDRYYTDRYSVVSGTYQTTLANLNLEKPEEKTEGAKKE
jgi:hypothetical protein